MQYWVVVVPPKWLDRQCTASQEPCTGRLVVLVAGQCSCVHSVISHNWVVFRHPNQCRSLPSSSFPVCAMPAFFMAHYRQHEYWDVPFIMNKAVCGRVGSNVHEQHTFTQLLHRCPGLSIRSDSSHRKQAVCMLYLTRGLVAQVLVWYVDVSLLQSPCKVLPHDSL